MAKIRSPNYPNRGLEQALGQVQLVFNKDGRNKISRQVIATHLGHESLSGPALGKIGALRAYGLIEGTGDELRVTDDAIAALMAPLGSDQRHEAIARLAMNPVLFQDIRREFTGKVSVEALTYWLIQNNFSPSSAAIAARSYFDTMQFAGHPETANVTQASSPKVAPPVHTQPEQPLRPVPVPRFYGGGEAMPAPSPVGDAAAPYRITMNGTKLHIEADVDLAGLQTLKQMLDGYEKILALLQQPAGQAPRPEWADKTYKPGDTVPVDGVWDITHHGHIASGSKEFSKGQRFLSCDHCTDRSAVRYTYRGPAVDPFEEPLT